MREDHFFIFTFITFMFFGFSCSSQIPENNKLTVKVGAERIESYLPHIQGKKVGLLVNHTSYIKQTHLLDTLLSLGISVTCVFAPEHGFRGNKSNGEQVKDGLDTKTGTPIISLYGKNKKPSSEDISNLDVVIYDIQDVGARFYTYISSMHYMMEACNENNAQMIILDRPNPNGHYVDGPILKLEHQSFVGMHPIPIVYGLTPGELAKMIIGEGWISNANTLDLKVISVANWDHSKTYELPISPSPNLPNQQSVLLYPSLCLFEGTNVSIGRGTDFPFQVIGIPNQDAGKYTFKPESRLGFSKYPKHQDIQCFGKDLRDIEPPSAIDLNYLIEFYIKNSSDEYFNSFFTKLVGDTELQKQIESGSSIDDIKLSWSEGLNEFKKNRERYLLYP